MVPGFGHCIRMGKIAIGMIRTGKMTSPFSAMIADEYEGQEMAPIDTVCFGLVPTIVVRDVALIEELFVGKNKYFEKHPEIKDKFKLIFGDSILFDESGEMWRKKRKSLSSAFYKEKLLKYFQIIKEECQMFWEIVRFKHASMGTYRQNMDSSPKAEQYL